MARLNTLPVRNPHLDSLACKRDFMHMRVQGQPVRRKGFGQTPGQLIRAAFQPRRIGVAFGKIQRLHARRRFIPQGAALGLGEDAKAEGLDQGAHARLVRGPDPGRSQIQPGFGISATANPVPRFNDLIVEPEGLRARRRTQAADPGSDDHKVQHGPEVE